MTKPQVESLLGPPRDYAKTGADELLEYPGGLISGWSYDTADFVVVLHNGLVTSYVASNIQKGQHTTMVIIPAPIKGN